MEQFIVIEVNAHRKIEACVSFVNDLEVMELYYLPATSKKFVYLDPLATIIL